MICIVVFCTTYALILPAITEEAQTFCGYEEHAHTEDCWQTETAPELICLTPEAQPHVHGEGCFLPAHAHGEACWQAGDPVLLCETPETAGHAHGEACYMTQTPIICGQEEAEAHFHSEACFSAPTAELVCGMEESEEHTHDEMCYSVTEGELVCTLAETDGHTHGPECCGETVETLVCAEEETEGHTHADGCYTTGEAVLICTLEERGENELVCTMEETEGHAHTDSCYTEAQTAQAVLICQMQEHTHTLSCCSDPAADVESAAVWERTFADAEMSGIWRDDLLAIARSQMGYTESTRNYIVLDDGATMKGYTRYGDWYGDHYGDWCAMFVSFCLHYAGVEGMPLESGCQRWIEALSAEDVALYHPEAGYLPLPGDLIFFNHDQYEDSDHVGLVYELYTADDGTARIRTIEGNTGDCVRFETYAIDDETIMGYAALPEQMAEAEPMDLIETTLTAAIYTDGTYEVAAEDATVITVSGLLPADAVVKAFPVTVESELQIQCAYDIAIVLSDGTIYEPEAGNSMTVSIQSSRLDSTQLGSDQELRAYYIPEEGEPQAMDTTVTEEGVQFSADHFSVYAVVAAETGESIPVGTQENAYYHSTTYPKYQISTHRFTKSDGKAYRAELYVLVSMKDYGGKTWTPDSTTWSASGSHNYVLTYCSDYYNAISGTGDTEYKYKTLLADTQFTAEQKYRLQCILENAYPFITEAEMRERLQASGYDGPTTVSAMMFGTQKAIWQITDNKAVSVYDESVPSATGVLNPITSNTSSGFWVDYNYVDEISEYLLNVGSADPGPLEITKTAWADNGDGTYTITGTLNRAMIDGEEITAKLSDGSYAVTRELDANVSEFTIIWDKALPEDGKLTLSISGTRPVMEVYYYDDGSDVQNLIGGEPGKMEEDDEMIVISSLTDVTVKKEWSGIDASAAPEITVHLLKNGEHYETVTLSSANGWTYTWKDLPATENGTPVSYTVTEETPAGYIPAVSSVSANGVITITLTNTAVQEESKTSVAVEKVWADGNDLHTGDSVTVQLYADGVYLRQLTLNAANGWKGTFEGLAYYRPDGVTPINYTLKEVKVDGYTTEINYTDVEPESTITWTEKSSLSAGTMYRFVSGGYALAMDAAGNLVSVPENPNDPYQWWTVGGSSNAYTLYNEKSGLYIQFDTDEDLFYGSTGYSSFRFSNKRLYYYESGFIGIGAVSNYMVLNANGISRTTNSSSATQFTIHQGTGTLSMPTYSVTITNTPVPSYTLPETGGMGTTAFTFSGMTLMAAALMWGYAQRRKRERGAD